MRQDDKGIHFPNCKKIHVLLHKTSKKTQPINYISLPYWGIRDFDMINDMVRRHTLDSGQSLANTHQDSRLATGTSLARQQKQKCFLGELQTEWSFNNNTNTNNNNA